MAVKSRRLTTFTQLSPTSRMNTANKKKDTMAATRPVEMWTSRRQRESRCRWTGVCFFSTRDRSQSRSCFRGCRKKRSIQLTEAMSFSSQRMPVFPLVVGRDDFFHQPVPHHVLRGEAHKGDPWDLLEHVLNMK